MSENYRWLNDYSRQFLEKDYLLPGQTVDERVSIICNAAEKILKKEGFAKKFKENFEKGWYSFSTPIWTNFGNDRGLPISCFGSYISDSMDSIAFNWAEISMMTKHGGGTSAYFGELRPRGAKIKNNGESSGSVHFMHAFDNLINIVSQGKCYIEGTEVLTDKGFKDFRKVNKETDKLAQVDEFNNVDFTKDYQLITEDFDGDLVCFGDRKNKRYVNLKVTPNHRMVILNKNNKKTDIVLAKDMIEGGDYSFIVSAWAGRGEGMSQRDKLKLAFQFNGKRVENKLKFNFDRETRKIKFINILEQTGIDYEEDDNKNIIIDYNEELAQNNFENWVKLDEISGNWAEEFINELFFWSEYNKTSTKTYKSSNRESLKFLQAICSLSGKKAHLWKYSYGEGYYMYSLKITDNAHRKSKFTAIFNEYYKGKVYCAIVPKGRLIVRYKSKVIVCGNTRRGNMASYLPIDHPDIKEFLTLRSEGSPIQDLSYGVCVPDYWMSEMINGDAEKRKVWAKVLESRTNTGYPYIFFTDNANKNTVDCYKDKNLKINHSNLCVTGDQWVVTDKGMKKVIDLYKSGEKLVLFDGKKPVNASEMKLIENNADVYKITTGSGRTHKVTSYHKIKTERGMIAAKDLIVGDKACIQREKGLFGKIHDPEKARNANSNEIPEWIWEADEETQKSYIAGVMDRIIYEKSTIDGNQSINFQIMLDNLGYSFKENDFIESIEYFGKEDVYCTTVDSEEHVWVCNSFITSNCTEIMLPNNEDESFVCDLSSMNILYFDEWKDTDAVELMVYFLDAVMTEFIDKTKNIKFMERPRKFAERHRALGIGWLGWHSYLQSKMIPWESMEAKLLNVIVAKNIKEAGYKASKKMAEEYGEPDVCKGYGRRNSTLFAIAPTKSSAFILGQVSEGVEPDRANYYIKDLQKGKFTIRNQQLVKFLESKGKNTDEVWDSILKHAGSVQHLEFLSENEKNVFKTFSEISPKEIIIQAAQRQKYIDQGQSVNLMIHPSTPTKDINALMIEAWRLGVKSLYYQISENAAQAFGRSVLTCANCEA